MSRKMRSDPILNNNMQIRPKQTKIAKVCKSNAVSSLRKLLVWFFFCWKVELFLFRKIFALLVTLNAIATKSDECYRENNVWKPNVNCVRTLAIALENTKPESLMQFPSKHINSRSSQKIDSSVVFIRFRIDSIQ